MDRRSVVGLALAAGLTVAACTEQPQDPSLQGQGSVANVAISCSPTSFNSLINGYFINGSTQWDLVRDYRDAMLATTDLGIARTNGFNILREIALRSKASPQPSPSAGSALAVETLECIFDVTDEENVIKPAPTSPEYFTVALNRTSGGVFEVRGGPDDPTGPVQAVVNNAVIAGISPPQSGTPLQTGTWDASLNNPQRVLFFGDPASSSSDYHFSVVPRAASFDPGLVVTTCVDDATFGANANSVMLTESDQGVLAFVDATYICFAPVSAASAGRFDLLRHLADLGRRLVLPEPAAAAAVMPGLVGGSAKGVKSLFDVGEVQTLNVDFIEGKTPPSLIPGTSFKFAVAATVSATVDGEDEPVFGTCVYLTGNNNNGTLTSLVTDKVPARDPACTEPPGGNLNASLSILTDNSSDPFIADFGNVSVTKTGGIIITVTADVLARNGAGSDFVKANVKPAK
jgi:hypothetical protein